MKPGKLYRTTRRNVCLWEADSSVKICEYDFGVLKTQLKTGDIFLCIEVIREGEKWIEVKVLYKDKLYLLYGKTDVEEIQVA